MLKVSLLALAVVTSACAGDPPPTGPTGLPAHNEPARIELSATPGTGAHGGQATVTARVLDGYAVLVPDVAVTFGSTAGTWSAATVPTDSTGIATTTLSADPGTVQVTARAGGVSASNVPVVIQPVNAATLPPVVPPPTPPPPPPPVNSPPPTDLPFMVAIVPEVAPGGTASVLTLSTTAPLARATWTFGDGTPSVTTTEPFVAHTYAAGFYQPSVAAVDTKGRPASDRTGLTVPPPVPVVTVSCPTVTFATPPAPATATVCVATATVNGVAATITSAVWTWGDSTPTSATGTHTYAAVSVSPGYVVSVTATVTGTTAPGVGTTTAVVQ